MPILQFVAVLGPIIGPIVTIGLLGSLPEGLILSTSSGITASTMTKTPFLLPALKTIDPSPLVLTLPMPPMDLPNPIAPQTILTFGYGTMAATDKRHAAFFTGPLDEVHPSSDTPSAQFALAVSLLASLFTAGLLSTLRLLRSVPDVRHSVYWEHGKGMPFTRGVLYRL